ncbi:hypothetical protein [Rhodopseudomonas telluris]|uniref:Uncharacterized protein n=1 Tax=Rhodopseudomonas telluris TaxID=644215 RepID=A0ABV6EZI7_9BRAD
MPCTRWTNRELSMLDSLAPADASDADLIAALPRHTVKAIKSRMAARGLRRPSTTKFSPKERQRQRMAQAGSYLAKRVAQFGPAALTRAAGRVAENVVGAATLECLIAASAAIHARLRAEDAS